MNSRANDKTAGAWDWEAIQKDELESKSGFKPAKKVQSIKDSIILLDCDQPASLAPL